MLAKASSLNHRFPEQCGSPHRSLPQEIAGGFQHCPTLHFRHISTRTHGRYTFHLVGASLLAKASSLNNRFHEQCGSPHRSLPQEIAGEFQHCPTLHFRHISTRTHGRYTLPPVGASLLAKASSLNHRFPEQCGSPPRSLPQEIAGGFQQCPTLHFRHISTRTRGRYTFHLVGASLLAKASSLNHRFPEQCGSPPRSLPQSEER
ncbi:hypothetical protein K0038_00506 [Pseudomonas syringae]|nr:hypothetical protein [Pseudomonas syringae]